MSNETYSDRRENTITFGPPLQGAVIKVFKRTMNGDLRLHMFFPEGHDPNVPRPAMVFFFGGGWVNGNPAQFRQHSIYLAERGMVASCAEYRVQSKHGTTPFECVADGKSAIRWLRKHATMLGIDPCRIAGGGGSAGGHVAACTATIPGLDEPGEDTSICSRPNALVLFNPVVDTTPSGWAGGAKFLGDRAEELSPLHHLAPGAPPTIIFHGTNDTTVPMANAERYRDRMRELGNECRLVAFDGMAHGFFNNGKHDNVPFRETLHLMEEFLVSLGYLQARSAM